MCFRISLDNSCLRRSRLEISGVSAPILRYTTSNVLREDHCFLFLNSQRDEGFECRHVSIADLIDTAIEDQLVES